MFTNASGLASKTAAMTSLTHTLSFSPLLLQMTVNTVLLPVMGFCHISVLATHSGQCWIPKARSSDTVTTLLSRTALFCLKKLNQNQTQVCGFRKYQSCTCTCSLWTFLHTVTYLALKKQYLFLLTLMLFQTVCFFSFFVKHIVHVKKK